MHGRGPGRRPPPRRGFGFGPRPPRHHHRGMFPPPPPRHGWGRPPRRGCMGCGCLPFVVLALGSMGALLMWLVF